MLCFVVDTANVASFSEAIILFLEALKDPELEGKPVLLLLNKMDMAPPHMPGSFKEALCWDLLQKQVQDTRQIRLKQMSGLWPGEAAAVLAEVAAMLPAAL